MKKLLSAALFLGLAGTAHADFTPAFHAEKGVDGELRLHFGWVDMDDIGFAFASESVLYDVNGRCHWGQSGERFDANEMPPVVFGRQNERRVNEAAMEYLDAYAATQARGLNRFEKGCLADMMEVADHRVSQLSYENG